MPDRFTAQDFVALINYITYNKNTIILIMSSWQEVHVKHLIIRIILLMLFATALACGVSFDDGSSGSDDSDTRELQLQLTQQSLQMTQAALSTGQNQQPAIPPVSSESQTGGSSSQSQTGGSTAGDGGGNTGGQGAQAGTGPCLLLGQVRDITIPDGMEIESNQWQNKTWELTNAGTCAWDANFVITQAGGAFFNSVSEREIGKSVPPGGSVQVTVPIVSPADPGNYTAYWKVRSSSGQLFGYGENADLPFWVRIVVNAPPEEPQPQPLPEEPEVAINWNASKITWIGLGRCPTPIFDPTLTITLTSTRDMTSTLSFRLDGRQMYPTSQKTIVCSCPPGNNRLLRELKANQPLAINAVFQNCDISNYMEGTITIYVYEKFTFSESKITESTLPFEHTCGK